MADSIIPPTFTVEDELERLPKPASILRRFIAMMLDFLVLWVAFSFLVLIFSALSALGGIFVMPSGFLFYVSASQTSMAIAGSVTGWLYFAGMQSGPMGATLGKYFMGLRVVGEEGNHLTFAQVSLRYWVKVLLSSIMMAGFILALFTRKKQALHDIIAKTVVVKK